MSQKWKGFENVIAKDVSQWLFGDPKILRRAPCSGGWKSRGDDCDIIVADESEAYRDSLPFAIEAKCRATRGGGQEWHLEQLLTSPKHPILDWWYQTTNCRRVQEEGKLRFLVFSKTSGVAKAFIVIGDPEVVFFNVAGVSLRAIPKIIFEVGRSEDPNIKTETLHIFRFREFLDVVDAKKVLSQWRNRHGVDQKKD